MTDEPDNEQQDEPRDGSPGDTDGKINDPLTRRDVEAPRVPFGSGSEADG
jgi:hypothetical protein